jgi:hypothetical protein
VNSESDDSGACDSSHHRLIARDNGFTSGDRKAL